jgi:hypothetical protein
MNLTLNIPESTQPPITVEVGGTTELTSYASQVAGLPDYPDTFPPAIGSAANQAVAGNDPRLTNSRAPSPHTHPLADLTGVTPAAIGAVATTALSTTGGASKVPQFGATADLTTGDFANDNVITNPGGNLWFPDKRGPLWMKRDGTASGAKIFMWEDHDVEGGELIMESPHRIALVWGENGAIQVGLSRGITDVGFIQIQNRNTATALSPLGKGYPIVFNSTFHNGTASEIPAGFPGMQARTRADKQVELVMFAGSTFPDTFASQDPSMPEIVALTPEGFRDPNGNAPAFVTLTDGGTITVTCATTKSHQNHFITLAGNRTLAFTAAQNGMRGTIIVSQDGTGSRTLTLPANSAKQSGFALTTAPYAVDKIDWTYVAGEYYFTIDKDFVLSLDTDAEAFLTAASITAASTEGIAVNNLVKQLKADDVWNNLIAAYPVVGNTSTAHAQDLKGAYDATFGAGVTHSTNGVTGSATNTGWMDTGVNISALSRRDDIAIYAYNKTTLPTDLSRLFGTSGTNARFYVSRFANSFFAHGPNSNTQNTANITTGGDFRGHMLWGRSSSTLGIVRFNAVAQTPADAAVSAPTASITFLAQNDGTASSTRGVSPTNANFAFCAITTAALGTDSAKWAAFTSAVNAFQTALGRQNV